MKKFFTLFTILILSLTIFTACQNNSNTTQLKVNFMVDSEVYHSTSFYGASIIIPPENPTKTGYKFDGWFLDNNIWEIEFSSDYFTVNPTTQNVNIYAKFTKLNQPSQLKVNFMVDSEVYHSTSFYGASIIIPPENPTKTGYNFDGWFLDNNIWEIEFTLDYFTVNPTTQNVNIYAKFTKLPEAPQMNINFIIDGNLYTTVKFNGKSTINLPQEPIKAEYKFMGWYIDEHFNQEFSVSYLFQIPFGSEFSVYAKFIKAPSVALICLHGRESSYDKNFIDAFEAACAAKGLTEDQYTIITGIPEVGNDCYDKAAQFANSGYKAVFADSFGHDASMLQAAKEFPNVEFCNATGTKTSLSLDADNANDTPANFHNAFASIYEGRYLTGVAAGLKLIEMYGDDITDEEAKIGYVGAFPYAEVISGYTSFYLGVKSIVPNVTMEVKYTYSWYDELKEKNSAAALIANGAKLVSGHADSMGVPTACKEANNGAGVPNVFYNGTTTESTFVIASKINWQPYFEIMIDKALGKINEIPKDYTGTLATGSVQITALGAAAAAGTQAKLDEVKEGLMNGTINVFDTANFTVKNAKADTSAFSKAAAITMDANGKLTAYNADVIDLGDYAGETNVIENGIFKESNKRSAPYFDIIIDGITII